MAYRILSLVVLLGVLAAATGSLAAVDRDTGVVQAAKLVYADGRTSICFSEAFLAETAERTAIATDPKLTPVAADAPELFDFPFVVMTGEGDFTLTAPQADALQRYLESGGFIVASAGCSSVAWNRSLGEALAAMFPDAALSTLDAEHPVYHTVFDIRSSQYRTGGARLPELRALELAGRIALLWSPDGLNDSAAAEPDCCCCGGNEVKSARQLNVNILAYALTH